MLVAVDVGNSAVKLGAFDGSSLRATARIEPSRIGEAELPSLLGVPPGEIDAVVAVSVNHPLLEAFLAGPGAGTLVLGRDLPLSVPNRYRDPGEVGHDRLANAVAAHTRTGGAAVVVDAGSAVTVDAVSASGEFLGGAIAPGREAFRAGLRLVAPSLPVWDGGLPGPGLPRSTAEAIRSGVLDGLAGLVDRLIRKVEAGLAGKGEASGGIPVYLTGGDAELLQPLLETGAQMTNHLTLFGVRLLYERAGAGGRGGGRAPLGDG